MIAGIAFVSGEQLKPAATNQLSEDDLFFLHNMVINMSAKEFTDNIIGFGRDNFNSDKLDQKEMQEMALLALEQRKNYDL